MLTNNKFKAQILYQPEILREIHVVMIQRHEL